MIYEAVKSLHSYWAYLVFIVLIVTVINVLIKVFGKKEYEVKDFRLALFTLILTHTQLLIGMILYVVSPRLELWSQLGGEVMKNPIARLYLVEHPIVNILAIAAITIGYSKHKKKLTSQAKLKPIAIFYTIGLVLFLSRIPWDAWIG